MLLLAAARERGIEQFRFEVVSSNAGMAELIGEIAPERTVETATGGLSLEVALPEVDPAAASLPSTRPSIFDGSSPPYTAAGVSS